jgi:hypothetical protein
MYFRELSEPYSEPGEVPGFSEVKHPLTGMQLIKKFPKLVLSHFTPSYIFP